MSQWLMGLGVICVLGVGAWGVQTLRHRSEVQRLNKRESLEIKNLYSHYYATSGLSEPSVMEIWQEIASTLHLPAEKLRPTDRFGHDVGTYLVLSNELDSLGELGAGRAKRLGIDVRWEKIATIDEYVRTLARRE